MGDSKFAVDYSKRLSKCQKCKQEIIKGACRVAKVAPNFFHDGDGDMKSYYHIKCLFETFKRARATTKVIEATDDIDGYAGLNDDEKNEIVDLIAELAKARGSKGGAAKKPAAAKKPKSDSESEEEKSSPKKEAKKSEVASNDVGGDTDIEVESANDDDDGEDSEDNLFSTFITICNKLAAQSGTIAKTNIIKEFIKKGKNGKKYKGDLSLFIHLLLPNSRNRVYNINSTSFIKLFSKLFRADADDMTKTLNKNGEIADTIKEYFEESTQVKPLKRSKLTLKQVDKHLEELTTITKEQEQLDFLRKVAAGCSADDLQMFIRLVKKDLRINAGEKAILDAITPNAYDAFKVSRDLDDVIKRSIKLVESNDHAKPGMKKDLSIKITLMKAVKPMLAEACKSVASAMKKCPNGIYAEIKYDGERLQVHKHGDKFQYYSRNLKPVQPHKVEHLKEFIPKAFPNASDLILDGEVLLYCSKTKKPLPFGTLGKHKKNAFHDATVCFFVFDCIYYNGKDLMNEPICERRSILQRTMKEIPGRIMLSEQHLIKKADDLREFMMDTIKQGLEGLVIKDVKSIYEPGKRHWLKMKKDYLDEGTMADTADLVCLGAYYGTGNKGGLKSVFLMGVYNEKQDRWQTVTKVGNGFDDKTLDKLQKEIEMVEIYKNPAKVPDWLDVHKTLVPDFVVKNPKKAPIWEVTGAEFSNSDTHTAGGISIRFPRVTRVRDDKSWKEATDLERLKALFKISKEKPDLVKKSDDDESPKKKTPKKRASSDSSDEDEPVVKKKPAAENKKPVNRSSYENDRADAKKPKNDELCGLPSVFQNCKIYLPKNCQDADKLKRYVIAYDGEVVDEFTVEDATHVIETTNMDDSDKKIIQKNKTAKRVNLEDLWKSIKSKKRL